MEYQKAIAELRKAYGLRGPALAAERSPSSQRLRMSRWAVAIIGAKMSSLQNAVIQRENDVAANLPDLDTKYMTVETSSLDIQLTPYCDLDGHVSHAESTVSASFDVTVKFRSRHSVRV